MEYVELLELASQCEEQEIRYAYCAAFAVTAYNSAISRVDKPFNPLLGEIFEFEDPIYKFISEQISFDPPGAAMHAEGQHFIY